MGWDGMDWIGYLPGADGANKRHSFRFNSHLYFTFKQIQE